MEFLGQNVLFHIVSNHSEQASDSPTKWSYCDCLSVPFPVQIGDRIVPKEVALLHNLQQECIIKLLDFFEDEGKFYIVMERPEKYIDLFDYITRKGTVSERSARYAWGGEEWLVDPCLSGLPT